MERRKLAQLAGIYANSNYDPAEQGQESPRTAIIREIDDGYEQLKDDVWARAFGATEEIPDAVPEDHPFLRASRSAAQVAAQRLTISMPGEQALAA